MANSQEIFSVTNSRLKLAFNHSFLYLYLIHFFTVNKHTHINIHTLLCVRACVCVRSCTFVKQSFRMSYVSCKFITIVKSWVGICREISSSSLLLEIAFSWYISWSLTKTFYFESWIEQIIICLCFCFCFCFFKPLLNLGL